ncbi:MAG TPA: type II secretion system protein [Fimbriimonadaceae bacterium]|nr:type II secretion system protein [Fimbriimonadaceae bacterium]
MRQRGLTLVETIVVTGIIAFLVAVTWLLIAPALKAKGIETHIRADLRQFVAAITMYRSDNDDRLPPRKTVLISGTPMAYANWPEGSVYAGYASSSGDYYYTQPYRMQVFESLPGTQNHFDPNVNPIVKALFFMRKVGRERYWMYEYGGGGRWAERNDYRCLCGFLDGSVRWAKAREPYEDEFATYSYLLGRTK